MEKTARNRLDRRTAPRRGSRQPPAPPGPPARQEKKRLAATSQPPDVSAVSANDEDAPGAY
jgi:hypothetical protein